MHQDGEASVEEILESIKKVIARDNRTSAAIQRKKRETDGVAEDVRDEISTDDAEEILDLTTAELIEEAQDDLDDSADDEGGTLIGDAVRDSMRENLAALAMLSEPSVPPQIVRTGETSLEGMVRDMLRPMLAEWLDANLPDMVERMVKDEISRIAGKRG